MNYIIKEKEQQFSDLLNYMNKLSKLNAIISSAYQYKSTENTVINKTSNQENAIIYGINSVNSKILTNRKKYENINESKDEILNNYKESLEKLGRSYDNNITMEYIRLLEEEVEQVNLYRKIYQLKIKESIAKGKADNSDDDIAEDIYNLEDVLSKSESKTRRIKTSVNSKIKEKNSVLMDAMEFPEKDLQTKIKGPQIFKNAKKFFFSKINPQKVVENSVFSNIRERIEEFKVELKKIKKNNKFSEENLIQNVNLAMDKSYTKLL